MPIMSDQIAQSTYAFQQAAVQQQQYAGMISQIAGQTDPGQRASTFAGGAINTAAAMAGPLMSGAMMLKGWDPFSMGISGAMAGYGRAGMMGAVGGGLMGAGLVAAPMMAAQYAGGQMLHGMNEQQQLYGQINQGHRHMNAFGGRGFTRNETHAIGDQFRHMTEMRGPGGEFTTMDELGRLASNMGRMGMAQGVRNAKDFNEKFQSMMKSVKEIAESFSTSLEQAQQIMGSMRGSGVFGAEKQSMFAKGMRGAAVGSNVSMDEVSQMAGVGSQLSRMVGGRGSAGAVAGVRAISTVGGALSAGVLSEEDVYNSTGLTGAAGRQAMASNMLQGDAEFFKSSRGRQLLAAIAKKDGSIDMDAVKKIQSGEVSVQDTIAMRGDHLNSMTRANFIRNEGRLRGEAMGAFGGMGKVAAYKGWIQNKGYDLDNMDDKSMLAFQRFAGVDRDEADNLIKMARSMESIQDKRQDNMREDDIMRSVEMRNRTVGIEGVKRKIEGAKHQVESRLKQTGADILDSAENMVERFFNQVMGEYSRRVEKGMAESLRIAHRGGQADVGFSADLSSNSVRNIEKVFGAKVAAGVDSSGAPIGDVMALSERDRSAALGGYLLGERGDHKGTLGGVGSALGNGMFGALGGVAGRFLGEAVGGLGLGGMSDADRAKAGAYLEDDKVLSMNRRMMEAASPEQREASIKELTGERDRLAKLDGVSGAEQDANARSLAVAMRRAGKSEDEIKNATGLKSEDLASLDESEQGIRASLGAQDRRRVGQALQDYVSFYKEDASTSLKSMDEGLYGVSRADLQKRIDASKSPEERKRLEEKMGTADKAHEFVGNYLLGMKGKHAEMTRLLQSKDPADLARAQAIGREMQQSEVSRREKLEGMDEGMLSALEASGVEGVSGMAGRELYEDKVLARAKKSGRKGATIQALANLMGGELDAETAKGLFGKSGAEGVKEFTSAIGLDMASLSDERKQQLTEALSAAAKGDVKALDEKHLRALDDPAIRESIRANQKEKQDTSASEQDPSFRKLDSMDRTMTKLLTVMGSMNDNTRKTAEALDKVKESPT